MIVSAIVKIYTVGESKHFVTATTRPFFTISIKDVFDVQDLYHSINTLPMNVLRHTFIILTLQSHQEDIPSVTCGCTGSLCGLNHGDRHQCSAYYI